MPSRILTPSRIPARVRIAATLFLGVFSVLGLVGTTWATGGIPWQVGDVVVCYGGGNCNVLRIHGTSVQLLDALSDGLLGSTGGAALNNSLHLLATDDKGGGSSKVVVYSIASINPFTGAPFPTHSVISTFDGSGGPGSSAAAIAVNSAGHIFVGNANGSGASIVELDAHGTPVTGSVFTFPVTGTCGTTSLGSLDIGANADSIYVTAKDGVIRKVSLPLSSASCSQFANFGSGVTLYGLKDIPAGALTGNCGATTCPSDETVVVVATGFTDPDASEPGETRLDAVNICTNVVDGTPVSCALLLDTNPNPGLTSPLWQAGTPYFTLGAPILDPFLHQQTVVTAGTSGADEPAFTQAGEPKPVIDNAVIWTDQAQPRWTANTAFTVTVLPGTPYIVDPNNNLQTVTVAGTSGPTIPTFNMPGTTVDGLVWSDQGAWLANHTFAISSPVGDASGHVHTVLTAGTSGSGALPSGGWNDSGSTNGGLTAPGITIDSAAIWTNQGPVVPYTGNHAFVLNTLIVDGSGHAQQAVEPGTSGTSAPSFSPITGGRTIDNAVTWTDQGQEFWHANFAFGAGAVVVDPAGHVQLVTTAGTSGPAQPNFTDGASPGGLTTDGLVWTDQGQPLSTGWQADAAFSLHQIIADNNSPQHFQQVAVAGTSGSTTPSFSTTGGYTLDLASLGPPPAPQTTSMPGGNFGDTNYFVEITYVNPFGETLPSAETVQSVATNNLLEVLSPLGAGSGGDTATGYNVYVSTGPSGSETKQNATPLLIGTNWTEPAAGLVSGAPVPTTNTTVHSVVWLDLGQVVSWTANTFFPLNAVIQDSNTPKHVQQATSAGTSGTATPVFSTSGGTISDNAVVWTDETALTWAANFAYTDSTAATTFVVDGPRHVQQAAIPGTSGPGAPTFVDGGTTIDASVTWTDEGRRFWYPSFAFSTNAIIVDAVGHVQQVTTAGTSGPVQPTFKDGATPGGTVTDGLQWTDQGAPGSWTAGASPALNAVILDSNTPHHVQQAVAANGSSGSQPPAFSTTGGLTVDGSVVWIDRGAQSNWVAGTFYAVNAVILDSNTPTRVQEATSAGTSGTAAPPFSTSGATVSDNAVVWTDQGLLSGNTTFTWQPTHPYGVNALIVDTANHQQQVTVAGNSGGSQPPFNDGGEVIDGLVWLDIGPTVTWTASTSFASGILVVDPGSFLQEVTTAGVTGTPAHPSWNETPLGNTVDGLQWTDQGHLVWQASHQYFTLGTLISDAAAHAQKVTEAGTSGGTMPSFNELGGTTIDNAATWTESHPMWLLNHPYATGNTDTLILDGNHHVQLVSTSGISGPTTPPFTSNHPLTGQTIDGLQWSNQATPATSVVARYPVAGVSTLQSLALDPLVANCTGNSCSGLPLPTRKTANFWLGDSVRGSFYKLDFATGTPITFTGACPTGCGIQSLVVYGGEGANQAGLASLVLNGSLATPLFTATANFLQNTITSTLSNNGSGSPPSTPISLYASLVDKNSCFNDPSVGNLACRATVAADPTKALVWKLDVPLNGAVGLPLIETLNSSFGPPGVFGVDASTDVFVDEQYDDTTFVGTDPGTRTISVHSLHEVPVTVSQGTAQCTYSSPLQNGTYKTNRGTLNFIFTCPGLTPTQFRNMHPTLSLVKKNPPQSPKFIPLSGTNGKGPYRFDSSGNFWTFQWNPNGATAGKYEGTTFDTTGVQSFTVTFSLK
jgi:hypothetical protein